MPSREINTKEKQSRSCYPGAPPISFQLTSTVLPKRLGQLSRAVSYLWENNSPGQSTNSFSEACQQTRLASALGRRVASLCAHRTSMCDKEARFLGTGRLCAARTCSAARSSPCPQIRQHCDSDSQCPDSGPVCGDKDSLTCRHESGGNCRGLNQAIWCLSIILVPGGQ